MPNTELVTKRSAPPDEKLIAPGLLAAKRWVSLPSYVGLTLILIVVWILALGVGAVSINPLVTLRVVLENIFPGLYFTGLPAPASTDHDVIWNLRMPRTLLSVICGAGLAVCGLATQALLRNILADPYILGIPSGASTGAAMVMVLGIGFCWHGSKLLLFGFDKSAHHGGKESFCHEKCYVLDARFL